MLCRRSAACTKRSVWMLQPAGRPETGSAHKYSPRPSAAVQGGASQTCVPSAGCEAWPMAWTVCMLHVPPARSTGCRTMTRQRLTGMLGLF